MHQTGQLQPYIDAVQASTTQPASSSQSRPANPSAGDTSSRPSDPPVAPSGQPSTVGDSPVEEPKETKEAKAKTKESKTTKKATEEGKADEKPKKPVCSCWC